MVVVESNRADTADARHATAEFLSALGARVDVEAVVLVVSELVANASRHTAGWWRLRIRAYRDRLVVDVDDRSTQAPAVRPSKSLSGAGGLGLILVDRLANGLEVLGRPDGKTVRATWNLAVSAAA
ncbi:ATP-binding protein [Streptomyces lycii]|uniref:ATP-binding protein n=1 Tax=Streptomyces lycii TaxID=2654337 RepID=A0ABQ7FIY9_9ACTN|nr:ATP-binding protein [Streptomyces lycii]KAF4408602.1 ATP-binding protein [Streptomyces lycii]